MQIQCVGAAYFDNLQLHGRYQVKFCLWSFLGEAAGVVKEVAVKLQPGEVALPASRCLDFGREQAIVHEMQCTKLPDEMPRSK